LRCQQSLADLSEKRALLLAQPGRALRVECDRALDQRDQPIAVRRFAHEKRERCDCARGRKLHDDFLRAFDATQIGKLDVRQQREILDGETMARFDARQRNRLALRVQQRSESTDGLGVPPSAIPSRI